MTPLNATERQYAEPPVDTEPYELGARDFEALRKAVLRQLDHFDRMGRDLRHYGGEMPIDLSVERAALENLHDRIVKSQTIFIHPAE